MKPLTTRQDGEAACRYEQSITIARQIAPNRFSGSYRSRHTCGRFVSKGSGAIVVFVRGKTVVIKGTAVGWTVETLQYISPRRMEGKDTRGYPAVYTRPASNPIS